MSTLAARQDEEIEVARIGLGLDVLDISLTPPATEDCDPADPCSVLYFFHPDHLGSGTFLSDANGAAYQFFLNLPFGETMVSQRNNDWENQYKYTGQELDVETGLYYYGARYYDPMVSQFIGVDPLAEQFAQWTPFHYVHNNPLKYTCLLYTSPSPRDATLSRMPSSA